MFTEQEIFAAMQWLRADRESAIAYLMHVNSQIGGYYNAEGVYEEDFEESIGE